MKLVPFRSIAVGILSCGLCASGAQTATARAPQGNQSASKQKADTISKSQKVANPLNDLLAEAQRDVEKGDFEGAIAPLQRVIADQPDFAYAHFQLAYVYTALKRADEARAEYARTIAIDPKMS